MILENKEGRRQVQCQADGPGALTDKSIEPFRRICSFACRREHKSGAAEAANQQAIFIHLPY